MLLIKFRVLHRKNDTTESKVQYKLILNKRESPLRTPIFLKNGQINRVTKVSSTFRPTESDSGKKLGDYLDSRRGNWI